MPCYATYEEIADAHSKDVSSGIGFSGLWGSSVMVALENTAAESQLRRNATDFVLLLKSPRVVDKLLKGGVKLGADGSAGAGPVTGAASKETDITAAGSAGLLRVKSWLAGGFFG